MCSHELLINFKHEGLSLSKCDIGHLSKGSDGSGADVCLESINALSYDCDIGTSFVSEIQDIIEVIIIFLDTGLLDNVPTHETIQGLVGLVSISPSSFEVGLESGPGGGPWWMRLCTECCELLVSPALGVFFTKEECPLHLDGWGGKRVML
jgi:hypothetical protein